MVEVSGLRVVGECERCECECVCVCECERECECVFECECEMRVEGFLGLPLFPPLPRSGMPVPWLSWRLLVGLWQHLCCMTLNHFCCEAVGAASGVTMAVTGKWRW